MCIPNILACSGQVLHSPTKVVKPMSGITCMMDTRVVAHCLLGMKSRKVMLIDRSNVDFKSSRFYGVARNLHEDLWDLEPKQGAGKSCCCLA